MINKGLAEVISFLNDLREYIMLLEALTKKQESVINTLEKEIRDLKYKLNTYRR